MKEVTSKLKISFENQAMFENTGERVAHKQIQITNPSDPNTLPLHTNTNTNTNENTQPLNPNTLPLHQQHLQASQSDAQVCNDCSKQKGRFDDCTKYCFEKDILF